MYRPKAYLIIIVLLAMLCIDAGAQGTVNVGSFHSFKGFGLSLEKQYSEDEFDSYSLYFDTYGILEGRHSTPGLIGTYTSNLVIGSFRGEESCVDIYWGPGLIGGYARDKGTSSRKLFGGVQLTGGLRTKFDESRVVLSLEMSAALAMKAGLRDDKSSKEFSFFKIGILNMLLPQVKIQYSF